MNHPRFMKIIQRHKQQRYAPLKQILRQAIPTSIRQRADQIRITLSERLIEQTIMRPVGPVDIEAIDNDPYALPAWVVEGAVLVLEVVRDGDFVVFASGPHADFES